MRYKTQKNYNLNGVFLNQFTIRRFSELKNKKGDNFLLERMKANFYMKTSYKASFLTFVR